MPRKLLCLVFAAGFSLSQNPVPDPDALIPGQLYRLSLNLPGDETLDVKISVGSMVLLEKRIDAWDPAVALYYRAKSPLRPKANLALQIDAGIDPNATESSIDSNKPVAVELNRSYSALAPEKHMFDGKPHEGIHWYSITNREAGPRMVYMTVQVEQRELPSDIDTFLRGKEGQLERYTSGQHSYIPEATQTMPGWAAFRTRRLEPGQTLLLRVAANHPEYKLRLQSYSAADRTPREAVQMGMDYLVSLGRAWHANQPRRGAVASREVLPHIESNSCVACHPTVFTTRAYTVASNNNFPPVNDADYRFLTNRLRSAALPFPGHPGAVWQRSIFSARAVSARTGAGRYLELAGAVRDDEEADGAAPNVSPAEIAYEAIGKVDLAASRNFFGAFAPRNVIDLNWTILGRAKLEMPTQPLVQELWTWQVASGLWPMHFDRGEAGAEFITWHALYALNVGGVSVEDPRMQRLIALCLSRQRDSGEWNGLPRHKSFETPFRDTQFAVMALSAVFPQPGKDFVPALAEARLPAVARTSPLLTRFWSAAEMASRYWHEPQHSVAALQGLLHGITTETDARVRSAFQQSLYTVLDENEGYLLAWTNTLPNEANRAAVRQAVNLRREALQTSIAASLSSASRSGKIALLNAMWDHPQRHAGLPPDLDNRSEVVLPAYHAQYSGGVPDLHDPRKAYEPWEEARGFQYSAGNSFYKTRVGNDSDLPDLGTPSPALERALLACLDANDPELATTALKALSVFPEGVTPRLTLAAIRLLNTPLASSVAYVFASDVRGTLAFDHPYGFIESDLIPALLNVLDLKNQDAIRTLLPAFAKLTPGVHITRHPDLQGRMERLLREAKTAQDRASTLSAAAVFPHIADGPLMRTLMLDAFASGERPLETAAIEIFVRSYVAEPTNPVLAKQFVEKSKGQQRRRMVDALDPARFAIRLSALNRYNPGQNVFLPQDANLFSSDVAQFLISEALKDADDQVRRAARELVYQYPQLRQFQSDVAPPTPDKPDYEYFKSRVQPILAQLRSSGGASDGRACVVCHSTQARFALKMPGKAGFTEAQSQANYESALQVVDLGSPKQSLLLLKPTRPNDNAGDPALHTSTHGGGTRWGRSTPEASASDEYETILGWIRGARLP